MQHQNCRPLSCLAHHNDQDAVMELEVADNGGDDVGEAQEGGVVDLSHDPGSTLHLLQKTLLRVVHRGQLNPGGGILHLLPLKSEKTQFRVVHNGQLTPGGGDVEHSVALGHKPGYKLLQ